MTAPEMGNLERALWIDWGQHLRSRTLSRRLGVDLVEICVGGHRLWRYARSALRTMKALREKRPDVVVATNPSIALGYLLLVLRASGRFKLVSDAHYAGVMALRGGRIIQWLLDVYNRKIDLVIVTNEGHARRLSDLGARTYVCPDPLPEIDAGFGAGAPLPEKSIFLVCSFDTDEPYLNAFAAFEGLQDQGFSLYVSGNYRKAGIEPSTYPWVRFLGFAPEEDYYRHLRSCSVVVDLTTVEDCLVCGAYEALAMGKPLVLSNTEALRDYFGGACTLTENAPAAIRENVKSAYEHRDQLEERALAWVTDNEVYMDRVLDGLRSELPASRQ